MTVKRGRGRPRIKYDPDIHNVIVHNLAPQGKTVDEICKVLAVSPKTFTRWKNANPELEKTWREGRRIGDVPVARALLNRALGMETVETITTTDEDGHETVTKKVKTIPPETTAALKWLALRNPEDWSESPININQKTVHEAGDSLSALLKQIDGTSAKLDE